MKQFFGLPYNKTANCFKTLLVSVTKAKHAEIHPNNGHVRYSDDASQAKI